MAEYQYPRDEFDELAAERRVSGAHRRRKSNARWWVAAVAVLVIAPLAGWGLVNAVGYHESASASGSGSSTATVTATPSAGESSAPESATPTQEATTEIPTAEPTTVEPTEEAPVADYSVPVQVLNASGISGLAATKQGILYNAGFTSVSAGNYSYTAPAVSQIYYPSEDLAATAQAVASTLGVDASNLIMNANATGGNQIIVVLAGEL